ncbi:hypothetical protein HHL22_18475 [Hymenobacter sp. RP-2-7]|uniref:Uncharacterized protein n=1 Tax=Hymenobacter polaris TaxID=2682546 RepID=A0A7Y0AH44_9BACT|nr:hypothetical protein [Hymenobacter polaris]NML67195.1 hypothetical protein [Hymenobacter polaris]
MKNYLSLVAALVLCGATVGAHAAPTQTLPDVEKVKVGNAKLKNLEKRDGKLKDGKLKTPFGKAKVKNGKVRLKL